MAKIKGNYVFQVEVKLLGGETGYPGEFLIRPVLTEAKRIISEQLSTSIRNAVMDEVNDPNNTTVTVTQLHAELYRDEPSEWTKEEAT